jgi:hypothetical protein
MKFYNGAIAFHHITRFQLNDLTPAIVVLRTEVFTHAYFALQKHSELLVLKFSCDNTQPEFFASEAIGIVACIDCIDTYKGIVFEVFPDTSTFTAGSTFTLYGVKAAA